MPNDSDNQQPAFGLDWPERRPRPPKVPPAESPLAALNRGRSHMLQQRLRELFAGYPEPIQEIVFEVLAKEQEYISMARPRGVKEDIGLIVNTVASRVAGRPDAGTPDAPAAEAAAAAPAESAEAAPATPAAGSRGKRVRRAPAASASDAAGALLGDAPAAGEEEA